MGRGQLSTSIYWFLGLNLGIERNNYQDLTLFNHNSTNNLNAYQFFLYKFVYFCQLLVKDSFSIIAMKVCKYCVCCIISPKHINFWADFNFFPYKSYTNITSFFVSFKFFLIAEAGWQYEHFLKIPSLNRPKFISSSSVSVFKPSETPKR